MECHLLDGTYELFRHYHAVPSQRTAGGLEVGATIGVLRSVLGLLANGATHLAVATDHVIESFRNELWPGYKDGSGIEPELRAQFEPLEEALRALGVVVWAMVEFEADDALAAGAEMAAADPAVERVLLCTPDKDLAQCVRGERIVQVDRRRRLVLDEAAVRGKYGVPPASIPDWLALVGDAADGYPGLPGWGRASAAAVLARWGRLERIPERARDWEVKVRAAERLAAALRAGREAAFLFRRLATLSRSAPVSGSVAELHWGGPREGFPVVAAELGAPELAARAAALAAGRAG